MFRGEANEDDQFEVLVARAPLDRARVVRAHGDGTAGRRHQGALFSASPTEQVVISSIPTPSASATSFTLVLLAYAIGTVRIAATGLRPCPLTASYAMPSRICVQLFVQPSMARCVMTSSMSTGVKAARSSV